MLSRSQFNPYHSLTPADTQKLIAQAREFDPDHEEPQGAANILEAKASDTSMYVFGERSEQSVQNEFDSVRTWIISAVLIVPCR